MEMKHKILSPSEPFVLNGAPTTGKVVDFWAWARSRLMADGPRGDLAEFIVNTALGMDMTIPKKGWGECDIVYPYKDGPIRIEVKCSTYLQAWEREKLSTPTFSIAKILNCDISENERGFYYSGRDGGPPKRRSEIYVFCLFAEKRRSAANPLDLDQWEFYIVKTSVIDRLLGNQRQISLPGLVRIGALKCPYGKIKAIVDKLSSEICSDRK